MREWKTGQEAIVAVTSCLSIAGERTPETLPLLKAWGLEGESPTGAIDRAFGTSIAGESTLCVLAQSSGSLLRRISDLGCGGPLLFLLVEGEVPFDLRPLARQLELPLLEPATPQGCVDAIREGIALSQRIAAPVLLSVSRWLLAAASMVELPEQEPIPRLDYQRESGRFARLPGAEKQQAHLEQRREGMQSWVEVSPFAQITGKGETGLIVTGALVHTVPAMEGLSVLCLEAGWPVDLAAVRRFGVKELYLLEESPFLAPILAKEGISIQPGLPWKRQKKEPAFPDLPERPAQLCPGCPWRGVLYTLKKEKAAVFVEAGCPVLGAGLLMKGMDGCAAGSPLPLALGFAKARPEKGGKTAALLTAQSFQQQRFALLKEFAASRVFGVVLLEKGNPGAVSSQEVAQGMGIPVVEADAHSLGEIRDGVRRCMAKPGSVLLLRGSCTSAGEVEPPYQVDREACTGCRQCLRVGCPAISFPEHKSDIDQDICDGCGLCAGVCPVKAIGKGGAQ